MNKHLITVDIELKYDWYGRATSMTYTADQCEYVDYLYREARKAGTIEQDLLTERGFKKGANLILRKLWLEGYDDDVREMIKNDDDFVNHLTLDNAEDAYASLQGY